jgi:ABC-type oligopeptide transport system substrate-binding subunit
MKHFLVALLIAFFAALILYQIANSGNIFEGLEGSSGCDCAQVYKNVGDITTLQNQVKQDQSDITDLKATVNTLIGTKKTK